MRKCKRQWSEINSAGAIQPHLYYTLLYYSDFETPYDPMIVVMAGKTAGEQQSQPV